MENRPEPDKSRKPRFNAIWIVPILAALIAGYLLFHKWSQRGPTIEVAFLSGDGIEEGETKLKQKGVVVGTVERVRLKGDGTGVIVEIELRKDARGLAREGTLLWKVEPEVGISEVSGLSTLVSGVHLAARAGDGPPTRSFQGLKKAPAPNNQVEGKAFLLRSDRLGGIKPRAPIYYRQVKVGEIETHMLATDATAVLIRARIFKPYVNLVRVDTRFWNASNSPLQVSLFGGKSDDTSIESIVSGAIAFATPEASSPLAEEGSVFELAESGDGSWIKWKPKIEIEPVEDSPGSTRPTSLSTIIGEGVEPSR